MKFWDPSCKPGTPNCKSGIPSCRSGIPSCRSAAPERSEQTPRDPKIAKRQELPSGPAPFIQPPWMNNSSWQQDEPVSVGSQGRLKSPLGFGRISHPCTGDVWGHFHRARVLELSAAPSRGNPALFPTTSYSWQLPSYKSYFKSPVHSRQKMQALCHQAGRCLRGSPSLTSLSDICKA